MPLTTDYTDIQIRLFSALIGMIAGAGLCIVLINRFLSQTDIQNKKPFIPPAFILIVSVLGIFGYHIGFSFYLLIPVVIICGLLVVEIQHLRYWKENRASPPVEQSGPKLSFFHPITTTDLIISRYKIQIPEWAGSGLRVTHLSDFHITDRIPLDYFYHVVEQINQTSADVVLYSGDFVTDIEFAELLFDILKGLRARKGIYAIFGNHDFWSNPKKLDKIVQAAGIHLIHNHWRHIILDDQSKVLIQGCEEPWSKTHWLAPSVCDGELNLALSHTADNIFRLNETGAHAVFSGHYHAGQFQIPGFGAIIVPSNYGRRYYQGHFLVHGTHLFVSAGIGAAKPPIRVYCQPDIQIVDIYGSKSQNTLTV